MSSKEKDCQIHWVMRVGAGWAWRTDGVGMSRRPGARHEIGPHNIGTLVAHVHTSQPDVSDIAWTHLLGSDCVTGRAQVAGWAGIAQVHGRRQGAMTTMRLKSLTDSYAVLLYRYCNLQLCKCFLCTEWSCNEVCGHTHPHWRPEHVSLHVEEFKRLV